MPKSEDHPPRPRRERDRQIDENLRRAYEEALDLEVPDRFKALLEELRSKTKS